LKPQPAAVTREKERTKQYVAPNGQIKLDLSEFTEPSKGPFEQIALFEEDKEITESDDQPSAFSLLNYLKQRKLKVIDQREKGGNLWIVGGEEIDTLIEELDKMGIKFNFTQNGSKSTNYMPGWYTTYKE
jgi:hypothetical protein